MLVKNAFAVSWLSLSLSLSLSVKHGSRHAQWHFFQMTGKVVRQNNSAQQYWVLWSEARPTSSEAACPAQHTLHRTNSYKDNKTAEEFIPPYNTESKRNRRQSSVLLHVI
jgi:hypothetical protein